MATDVSIAFKASDKLSDSIRGMQKNVKSLSRDVGEYRKIAEQAFDKKKEISLDITKAKTELKALEKAVKQGDETAEKGFKEKRKHLDLLQEEYKRLGRVVKDAGNAEKSLADDISRNSNRYASRSAPDLANGLKNAGLGAMLGNATGGLLGQIATSSFGTTTGSAISDIAGGAATGAAMGSLGGPVAAGIGAAIGGLTGAINTLTKQLEKKDDIFREEVKGISTDIEQRKMLSQENGISNYIERQKQISGLSTLIGSESKGNELFQDLKNFGINTPYQTNSMINSAKQMLAYGIKEDKLLKNINMLGEIAMGDQQKFDSLSYAYSQIQSAGRLTGQDLLQLTSAGFNPLKILAEEQGKTLEQMRDIMSKGSISADDVTHAFEVATGPNGDFYGAMSKLMETYGGKKAMLNDVKSEIDIAYGEGYTSEHIKGIEYELNQYNGKNGDKFKNIQKHIGAYEASLKNKETEIYFNTFNELFEGEEYKKLEKILAFDGASTSGDFELQTAARWAGITQEMVDNAKLRLDEMYFVAEGEAKAKWLDSPEHQKALQSSIDVTESLQGVVRANSEYISLLKQKTDVLSKGLFGGGEKGQSWLDKSPEFSENYRKNFYRNGNGHATGLDRVPHDDYFARLHEGERVLTRLQADELDRKESKPPVSINLTVNAKTGDPYELAQVLYSEIKNAMENLVDNS